MCVDYSQDANCQGAWLFKEGTGTTVDDSSANSNTGTFKATGEPAWNSTDVPKSYTSYSVDFDGTDDYIQVADHASLDMDYISVGGWMILDTDNTYQYVLSRDAGTTGNRYWTGGKGSTDVANKFYGVLWRTDNTLVEIKNDGSVVAAGTWHHYFMLYNGTNAYAFLDGVQGSNFALSGVLKQGTEPIYIGAQKGNFNTFTNGRISECAIFNDILTSTEVNDIMDNGLLGAAGGAVDDSQVFIISKYNKWTYPKF